jgi:nitrite reductase (NADH) large subunit
MICFRKPLTSTQLKVTGIDVFSAGDFNETVGTDALVLKDETRGVYKRVILRDNRMQGAILYGDTRSAPWYLELMQTRRDVGTVRDRLLFGAPRSETVQ